MTPKDYLYTAILCAGRPHAFIETARSLRPRYILAHFILIFAVLYFPVFFIVARTQPHEMYGRVFSLRFEDASIQVNRYAPFAPELLTDGAGDIFVFEDYIVYSDGNVHLAAPAAFFDTETLPYTFEELFSMLAMYNMYIPHLLVPMLLLSMFIMLVLKIFFYAVTAYFLSAYRVRSYYFSFGERVKIAVASSLPVALICAAVGFFLPIVHIILFQLVNLMLLFYMSKRYDLKEKEMMEVM